MWETSFPTHAFFLWVDRGTLNTVTNSFNAASAGVATAHRAAAAAACLAPAPRALRCARGLTTHSGAKRHCPRPDTEPRPSLHVYTLALAVWRFAAGMTRRTLTASPHCASLATAKACSRAPSTPRCASTASQVLPSLWQSPLATVPPCPPHPRGQPSLVAGLVTVPPYPAPPPS